MDTFKHTPPVSRRHQYGISVFLMAILLISMSCDLTGGLDASAQQTLSALSVQETVNALQSGANAQATNQAMDATRMAQDIQATMLVQQITQLAAQASQQALVTEAPPVTVAPPAGSQAPPQQDVEAQIKAAKILLFDDMTGYYTGFSKVYPQFYGTYPAPYIKEALDMGSYSYKDDGSAMGWFKEDLLSTTTWDLIIAGSEARTKIQGEYFVYLLQHINRGAAVIIEMWDLDELSAGKVAPILSKCGIEWQRNWFEPDTLALWPLIPDHPIFSEPNKGISMSKFGYYWFGDHGDLVKASGSGDAQIILGTTATSRNDHGALVSCMGGRLLFATYSDHDYAKTEVVPLWENMIHYALKNKFLATP